MRIKHSRSYNVWRIGLNFFIPIYLLFYLLPLFKHYLPTILTTKIFIDKYIT